MLSDERQGRSFQTNLSHRNSSNQTSRLLMSPKSLEVANADETVNYDQSRNRHHTEPLHPPTTISGFQMNFLPRV